MICSETQAATAIIIETLVLWPLPPLTTPEQVTTLRPIWTRLRFQGYKPRKRQNQDTTMSRPVRTHCPIPGKIERRHTRASKFAPGK